MRTRLLTAAALLLLSLSACSAVPIPIRPAPAAAGRQLLSDFTSEFTIGASAGGARTSELDATFGFVDLGYQFAQTNNVTLGWRLTGVAIDIEEEYDNDFGGRTMEISDGGGLGVGVDMRFFPDEVLTGFWIGIGALYFPLNEGDTEEREYNGSGMLIFEETTDFELDSVIFVSLGYSQRFSSTSLGTELIVGVTQEEESTFFAALGIRLGFGS